MIEEGHSFVFKKFPGIQKKTIKKIENKSQSSKETKI